MRKVRTANTQAELKAAWGDIVDGVPFYPIHSAQADILASTAKYTVAIAGSGGGKSVLIALWLRLQVEKNPGGTFLIILPSYGHIEQTNLLDRLKVSLSGTWHEQRKTFYLATGGKIHVKSADIPENIEGIHAHAICVDEAKDISPKAWRFTKSRSGSHSAPFLITTTLDYNNWVYNELFLQCTESEKCGNGWRRWSKDKQYYVRQWASADRPGYDMSFLEQERRILSASEFGRRYLGEVTQLDGLVYDTLPNATIAVPTDATKLEAFFKAEFKKHPAVEVCGSVDFGFDPDPCAIHVGVLAQDGRIYIVDEVYENRLSFDQVAKKCWELKEKWDVSRFYCDSSGKANISHLVSRGIPASKRTIPAIDVGCSMVNARLRTDMLKVYDCCANLIDEGGRYVRAEDNKGGLKDKPTGKDHALDSLRYLITGMDYMKPLNYRPSELQTAEDKEAKALQRDILLGRMPEDPEERRIEQQKMEEQRYAKRFYDLAFGDLL